LSANFGVAPLLEGDRSGRPDFARLRRSRRGRLFAAMAEADIDVLVLGRPANIAFASGSRLLWTAGTRPFAPGCVVVAGTGRVHLLSTWDEGVPEELAHDDLFGLSWNPAVVTEAIRAIPGLAEAKVVGTDGWGPGTAQIGRVLFPAARLLDGGPVLARARTVKSVDEVACIATACALAESALTTMIEAATPGVTERQLVAAYAERIASLGSPAPPT
jgi:Xaa-Pro aminopeptidase